jgi:cobalt-zinc-cadmium efflux system membrane fusion protein
MTHSDTARSPSDPPRRVKIWRSLWMIVATLAAVYVIAVLIYPSKSNSQTTKSTAKTAAPPPTPPVQVAGPGLIAITPGTPLHEQLTIVHTKKTTVRFPRMLCTGSVVARIADGKDSFEDRWRFATQELSTTYADWVRAKSEVEFADGQYKKTQELVKAETVHLQAVVDRLKPLNQDAAVTTAQLKQAQADLIKAQLQGEKDVFSAQLNLRTAQKTRAALERTFSQAGIEPVVFGRAVDNMVLVVANVPENRIAEVETNQACEVRFYGYPDKAFPGHVESISTTITPDRRMLRVLFELTDAQDLLRPGMFGEVGLGTNAREAILVPPEALLHLGRWDYMLVRNGSLWKVTEVKVGELHDGMFEILSGLEADCDVIARGTILLKPPAAEALTAQSATTAAP